MSHIGSQIGQWTRRRYPDREVQRGKWHKVESEVADDVITRCGRRMARKTFQHVFGAHFLSTAVHLEFIDRLDVYFQDGLVRDNLCSRCQ